MNRYRELIHDEAEHRPPMEILSELGELEREIQQGITELKAMLQ
jgi:type I restriction enzyme M protein